MNLSKLVRNNANLFFSLRKQFSQNGKIFDTVEEAIEGI